MIVIGLTGSIGAGKSTVAHLFADHGVPIIDADIIAREVTEPHSPAYDEITARFGGSVVNSDGTLDRGSLREIIFHNPEERRWLEELLHPVILERMREEISKLDAPYCIAVIPLLLETEAAEFVQRILVVDIPEDKQIERAKLRDKSTSSQIKNIIKAQLPRDQRLTKADDVINNAGSPDELIKQVDNLHKKYLQLGA
ncbi:MAG TPA: dephospho-CoA kinase [Gammaproteobacteria bacterium]|jgi:dephospho-CoA kinase|nr:dephospho-CoA kinase [Gammaproteobacteria bacterium]